MRTDEALQTLCKVTAVILNKTGTLAAGKPALHEIEPHGVSEDVLVALAAAFESASKHPLAQAIVQAAFDQGLDLPEVEALDAITSKSTVARLAGSAIADTGWPAVRPV